MSRLDVDIWICQLSDGDVWVTFIVLTILILLPIYLMVFVVRQIFSSLFKRNKVFRQTQSHGQPPFRNGTITEEIQSPPSKLLVWLTGGGYMINKWFSKRVVQLIFRLSIIPMFAFLIYWSWVALSGSTVPSGTLHLPISNYTLFSISRLTDIPGALIMTGLIIWSIREILRGRPYDKDLVKVSVAWFVICGTVGVLTLIVIIASGSNPNLVSTIFASSGLIIAGVFLGLCSSEDSDYIQIHKNFPIIFYGTLLCCLGMCLPFYFIDGLLIGLIKALVPQLVFSLAFFAPYIVIKRKKIEAACPPLRHIRDWFTAADMKNSD